MGRLQNIILAASILSTIIYVIATNLAGSHSGGVESEKNYSMVALPSGLVIQAEIARTPEQRATGLMNRTFLGTDQGMLFVFDAPAQHNFWMKNTLIPLDIIFISEDLAIVKIHHAVPCTADPCPTYSSAEPAIYVLEVNGNLTAKEGIAEGSTVVIIT